MGWAHSVEAWHDGELAGGLYGVRIGGFFAGESMFHRVTNASKVALWATVELLRLDGAVAVRRAVDARRTCGRWARSTSAGTTYSSC